MPDCASVVVEQNSILDPLGCPEWDGSHQAPLGRKIRAPRRRMQLAGISAHTGCQVSDLLVDSNMNGGGDPVPKPAPSELAEHLTSVEHSLRPGYPVQGDTPCRKVGFYDNQTVSDLLVDLNTDEGGDPVPRWAPSELTEHSASVEHSLRPLQPESSEYPAGTPRGVVGVSDNQPVSEPTEQLKTGGNLVLKPAEQPSLQSSRGRERDFSRNGHSVSAATCGFAGNRPGVTTVGWSTTEG